MGNNSDKSIALVIVGVVAICGFFYHAGRDENRLTNNIWQQPSAGHPSQSLQAHYAPPQYIPQPQYLAPQPQYSSHSQYAPQPYHLPDSRSVGGSENYRQHGALPPKHDLGEAGDFRRLRRYQDSTQSPAYKHGRKPEKRLTPTNSARQALLNRGSHQEDGSYNSKAQYTAESRNVFNAGLQLESASQLRLRRLQEEALDLREMDDLVELEELTEPKSKSKIKSRGKTRSIASQSENKSFELPKARILDSSTQSLRGFLEKVCTEQVTTAPRVLNWSLDDAIQAALLYSFQIDQLRVETLENYQEIGIQFGRFDTLNFFEQTYRDSNSPAGNNFESNGNVDRVRGEELNLEFGLRKELQSGGQLEIANTFGTNDNDSGTLTPPNQASSGLTLRLSKELLRGAGHSIGLNDVLVATRTAHAENFDNTAEIVALLQQVSDSYWAIFAARADLVAAVDNVENATLILSDLEARKNIDADPNLLEQARSAMLQQRVIADQAYAAVALAQIELIRLVNAPELAYNTDKIEIIPRLVDFENFTRPDFTSRLNTAIHNRPEIKQVLQQIEQARLEHHFSLNDLLPRLTFNAEGTFEGLAGDRDLAAAAKNRFDSNATYELGFSAEFSLQNRRARFEKRRAELAIARLNSQWKAAVEDVKKDVAEAVQNLETNNLLVQRQQQLFESSRNNLIFLEERRYNIPKEGAIPSLQLGQLLDVLERLSTAKADFAQAIGDRTRAQFDLNRASGILVQEGCRGLENPGTNNCLLIYHQYRETEKNAGPCAECFASDIATISKTDHPSTWKSDSFGYPKTAPSEQGKVVQANYVQEVASRQAPQKRQAPQQQVAQQPVFGYPRQRNLTPNGRNPVQVRQNFINSNSPSSHPGQRPQVARQPRALNRYPLR